MKNIKVEMKVKSIGSDEIKIEIIDFLNSIFKLLGDNRNKIFQIQIRTNFTEKIKDYPVYKVVLISDLTQDNEFDLLIKALFESMDRKNIKLTSIDKVFVTLYIMSNSAT